MQDLTPWILLLSLALPVHAEIPVPAQAQFFQHLTDLCGARFEGQADFQSEPSEAFSGKTLVAHVAVCEPEEIRIPFRVGEDRSRTWILKRVPGGLELKHDHRHADGTPDEITMYGGTTANAGEALSQSFPADAHTAELIPAASTNVWTLSLSPDRSALTYSLTRHGKPRFRTTLTRTADDPAAQHARTLIEHAESLPAILRPGPLVRPLDHPSRRDLDFFPGAVQPHHGLALGSMLLDGRRAGHELLRSALSDEGYLTAMAIVSLEDELLRTQQDFVGVRRPDDYAFEIFGEPGAGDPWAWKFEGHHLSINVTHSDGTRRVTPLMLGGSPIEIERGPRAGMRVMDRHQRAIYALVNALTTNQRERAALPATDASEVERGTERTIRTGRGLSARELTAPQRGLLLAAISAWTDTFDRTAHETSVNDLHLAIRGVPQPGVPHYLEITGPSLYLQWEVVTDSDGSANHVHSVWGDPTRDFGRDLLGEHRREAH